MSRGVVNRRPVRGPVNRDEVASQSIDAIRDAIRWGASRIRDAGIDEGGAAREAAVLLSHCMGITVAQLYTGVNVVAPGAMRCYEEAIGRRQAREPLQYITGVQEFMSLEFKVDRRVLIPRPETEVLVETAIEFLRVQAAATQRLRFADVGTGSGAIAISIARYAGCGGYALDSSRDALDVAVANARVHGVDDKLVFLQGDLLKPLAGRVEPAGLDCVVSNPPYVTAAEYERLQPEIRDHEPAAALLCDDPPGLYGRLAVEAARPLGPGGLLAVEVGYGQADAVAAVFERTGFYYRIEMVKDLRGIDRVVRCNRSW